MDSLFAQVDVRFAQVDTRFEQVDARFGQVDARFAQVDIRLLEIQSQIVREGETTRRHFDVVAERLRAEISMLAAAVATINQTLKRQMAENSSEHTTFVGILDEHELRLKSLERYRR